MEKRLASSVVFAALLLIGILSYSAFGLGFDEYMQRDGNGITNYGYVVHLDDSHYQALVDGNEKYHGPVFELALILGETVLHLRDTRDIFLFRHLATFLLFWSGCLAFYFLIRRTGSESLALTAACTLFFTPRIFGDAFHNSKDIPFLCMGIIALLTLLRFLESPRSISRAIVHALACAVLIDIRILGVILPGLSAVAWTIDGTLQWFRSTRRNPKAFARDFFPPFAAFTIGLVVFVIAFWPVLWRDPIHHFNEAWTQMKSYPWRGNILYLGKIYLSDQLPWHYLPLWIFISTPISILALIVFGIVDLPRRATKLGLAAFWTKERLPLIAVALGLAPVAAIIVLQSVVYDGWRHVFFVYPPLLLCGFFALARVWSNNTVRLASYGIVAVLAFTVFRMHPHQNVYFNRLAGEDLAEVLTRFEGDYWGLSYRQALEKILKAHPGESIPIATQGYPGRLNVSILPESDRKRLQFVDSQDARYILTEFRTHLGQRPVPDPSFSVEVDGGFILSVYRRF